MGRLRSSAAGPRAAAAAEALNNMQDLLLDGGGHVAATRDDPDAKEAVEALVPAITREAVRALRAHPRSASVQDAGCGLIQNLGVEVSREAYYVACSAGAPALLVAAVRNFPRDDDVVFWASIALHALLGTFLTEADQWRRAMAEAIGAGAVDAYARVLRRLTATDDVTEQVIGVLGAIAERSDNAEAAAGAMRVIVRAAQRHREMAEAAAWWCLDSLPQLPGACERRVMAAALEEGAAEMFARRLAELLKNERWGREGHEGPFFETHSLCAVFELMRRLAAAQEEESTGVAALLAAGALELTVGALTDERVAGRRASCAAAACEALYLLTSTAEGRARAEAAGCAAAVASAARWHPKEDKVQLAAARLFFGERVTATR